MPVRTECAATAAPEKTNSPLGAMLEGVINGDWAAWSEIIARFEPLVLYTARRVGLDSADAADVAQLTWFLLWKHGHQVRNPDHCGAWLVATARREAIRLAKAASRIVPCADPETEYRGRTVFAVHDVYPVEGDFDGAVAQALDRLPVRYRTLLTLITSDLCLSYAEIAERMGLSIGSIGPLRMRALEMLEQTPEFRDGLFPRPAFAGDAAPKSARKTGGNSEPATAVR
ncbi:MAG TPA: sigma-70 family RNA polymerase sigma factor [Actinospica sp.]|jgi:RNA polymerase sigma factor (sigma-70 family)|nr:sigma-70 family RNA polymerase sigma factor [Actinospica sp.]